MTGFLLFVSREGIGWAHYENQIDITPRSPTRAFHKNHPGWSYIHQEPKSSEPKSSGPETEVLRNWFVIPS